MREINLSNNKFKALVDDSDFEKISKFKWYPQVKERRVYAQTWMLIKGEKRQITMHQFLTGFSRTDHVDGNSLNNQRRNLRPCTTAENAHNSRISSSNKSGFKGVCFEKQTQRWKAQITLNYKNFNLGRFDSKIDAALAYNVAAIKMFGEFAVLNKTQPRL